MSVFLQPIYTQTVGSGGASSITFNSIPQTFTDLALQMSLRTTASAIFDYMGLNINNGSAVEIIRLQGTGSAANSTRSAGGNSFIVNGNTSTANTFSSSFVYLPNYTTTNSKQFIIDTVTETNATGAYQELDAMYFANSSTSTTTISLYASGNFMQYSTFSLYGVLRQGI